jgi:hypothetical protein
MTKGESATAIIGTILLWFGFRIPPAPSVSPAPPSSDQAFILAVVGNGLSGTRFSEQECAPNVRVQESACAMARGAYAAYNSDIFNDYRQIIKYRQYDDGLAQSGSKESRTDRAADLAFALQDDARTLAVIGHSFSETTAVAARSYKLAQIPLLVPIATSPTVGYETPTKTHVLPGSASDLDVGPHLPNVFRLVPNDKIAQAPAIGYVVKKLSYNDSLKAGVLADLSENPDYTTALKSALQKQRRMSAAAMGVIDKDCKNNITFACMIWDDGDKGKYPDLIVFIGTTNTSQRFLDRFILAHRAEWFPHLKYLLLSDGCKNVGTDSLAKVAAAGIQVLITFPAKQLTDQEMDTTLLKPLKDAVNGKVSLSYEEFGFESVLLLKLALDRLAHAHQPLSRPTLIAALNQIDIVRDLPTPYIFENGENIHPDYGLYGIGIKVATKPGLSTCDFAPGGVTAGDVSHLSYLCSIGFDDVNITR